MGFTVVSFSFLAEENVHHYWGKKHNSGRGCKVTHGYRILRERAGRGTGVNWLWWIFLGWRLREKKPILTPPSLPDLRVMEAWCVLLINKNHTDTLLVKMREEKCILLLFTFQQHRDRKEESQERRWIRCSLAFGSNRCRRATLKTFKNFKTLLTWDELLSQSTHNECCIFPHNKTIRLMSTS